jgi:preprotein translocase subunit Sec61beta
VLDLFVLPIRLTSGVEDSDLSGLLVAPAPRRCERTRSADVLIVQLKLGGAEIPREEVDELLQKAAGIYFQARGSVTAGMRQAGLELNRVMLERFQGRAAGQLAMLVIRREAVYQAVGGSGRVIRLSGSDLVDTSNPGGIAVGRGTSYSMQYEQAEAQSGDTFILAGGRPEGWTDVALQASASVSIEHLRRKLCVAAGGDIETVLVQFRTGKGELHLLKRRSGAAAIPPSEPATAAQPERSVTEIIPEGVPSSRKVETPQAVGERSSRAGLLRKIEQDEGNALPPELAVAILPGMEPVEQLPLTTVTPDLQAVPQGVSSQRPRQTVRQPQAVEQPVPTSARQPENNAFRKQLAAVWLGARAWSGKVGAAWQRLINRIWPSRQPKTGHMSPGSMLFIAIAVPLVVVAISVTVYMRNGRGKQYNLYFQQAQTYATQASLQTDQLVQRVSWTQVLQTLDKSDEFMRTEDSISLRNQAQAAIDSMDGVARLDLQMAVPLTVVGPVQIDRMVSNNSDVFMLDTIRGRVLRMFLTGDGYKLDETFQCSPGPVGGLVVGPLLDVEMVPLHNPYQATVMAIDGSGMLLFCNPGSKPIAIALTPPDLNWGKIVAISINLNQLSVLDSTNNMVYYYEGEDMSLEEGPRLFFDSVIPPLSDVVDIAMYGDDLFLLHANSKMTTCLLRVENVSETECIKEVVFGDRRPNRDAETTMFQEARFNQMMVTQPPEPSFYIMDLNQAALYHFSVRMNLQRLLKPPTVWETQPTKPISAFSIAPNRIVVVAFGDQIYYAPLP